MFKFTWGETFVDHDFFVICTLNFDKCPAITKLLILYVCLQLFIRIQLQLLGFDKISIL